MPSTFTRTLALAATALAMVQMSPAARAGHSVNHRADHRAGDCAAAHADAAPVADDPKQPLDPRDPQFAQKLAQRYRQLGQSTAREVR